MICKICGVNETDNPDEICDDLFLLFTQYSFLNSNNSILINYFVDICELNYFILRRKF